MFSSSQNTSITCPFCSNSKHIGLILKENLLIGSTNQLDYREILSDSGNAAATGTLKEKDKRDQL